MQTNRWIDVSQRFYHLLLRFYPRAYRQVYEQEMFHVFRDLCRDVYKQHGWRGVLGIWPRTLIDLGVTATLEQLGDPAAGRGLLEAVPGSPLPWKGVLLVLVPGLIFFVSQIVQLTSTEDWFFLAVFRAAYFLILPVLLIWVITRRFPVWGLIPFGLLYETIWSYVQRFQFTNLPFFDRLAKDNPFLWLNGYSIEVSLKYLLLVPAGLILLGALVRYYARRGQTSWAAWGWLGVYALLIVFQVAGEAYRFIAAQDLPFSILIRTDNLWQFLIPLPFWVLYDTLAFLLLVFIGTFFARKHGGLSFLVLLGYLLPTVIFGRYGIWNESVPFILVSVSVLLYRFVVALVAPVWLVRAASVPGRRRAVTIPVFIALASQISLNVIAFLINANFSGYQPTPLDLALNFESQLILIAGLGLAVALYLPPAKPSAETTIPPSGLSVAMQ